jgi:hypothetical protein
VTRLWPSAVAASLLAACAPRAGDRIPSDSAAARSAASRPSGGTAAGPLRVGAEAEAVCTAVAGWWRRDTSATVHLSDSLLTPWQSDSALAACVVRVRQEHGSTRDSGAAPDGSAASLGAGTTLVRAAGKGWVELVRFMADGPDGSSSRYQRGAVRCAVEQSWDGGDDSDPAYVPEDWYEEHTICWAAPGGVAVSDTAP